MKTILTAAILALGVHCAPLPVDVRVMLWAAIAVGLVAKAFESVSP